MDSVTKNRCDKYQIGQMIKSAFGEKYSIGEDQIKELEEGAFNAVYRVAMPERNVIIKIAPPPETKVLHYEKNLMSGEVTAMKLVKDKTKVPLPEIYYYDHSHRICNADYFIMEELEEANF